MYCLDGQVDNRENVLSLTAQYAKKATTFALGIGEGVDKVLIEKAAGFGGSHEFTGPGKHKRFFKI